MLENLLKYKNKEIKRLEYLNKHLIMSLEKRDEMLSHTIEENRKLKELTILYERMMDGSLHPRKKSPNFFTQTSFKTKNISSTLLRTTGGSPLLSPTSPSPNLRKRSSLGKKLIFITSY